MYNESQKLKFINSLAKDESYRNSVKSHFVKIEKYERDIWKQDLSTVTPEMLTSAISEILSSCMRNSTVKFMTSAYKKYVTWCINSGLPSNPDLLSIKGNMDASGDKLSNKMVSSPSHLKEILDDESLFRPTSEKTVDVIHKGVLWLAFSGIELNDAIKLTSENIFFKHNLIYTKMGLHPIYQESINELEILCKNKVFNYHHPLYSTVRDRYDGEEILRGFSKSNTHYIQQDIAHRFCQGQPYEFTYKSIYLSGEFYRMYQKELYGMPVNFIDLISKDLIKRSMLSDGLQAKSIPERKFINNKHKEYLRDYIRWKEVFNL